MDLISVIMPIYNMGQKIKKGLESVLNQTYKDLEVIIIDDGSTDNSYDICKEFSMHDSRIKLFQTENKGSGAARNYGIEMSLGKYLYFMDADDEIDKSAFEILVSAMKREKVDLVVFGYLCVNEKKEEIGRKQYKYRKEKGGYIRKNYEDFVLMESEYAIQGTPWNKLFLAENVKKNKVEYPDLRRQQDEIFIARYVETVKSVCFIEDILYFYYVNDVWALWDKFPDNYIDISNSLLQYRLDLILKWNPQNIEVKRCIYYSYMEGVIICTDLVFNPKKNLSAKGQKKQLIKLLGKMKTVPYDLLKPKSLSHKISIFLIRYKMINILYCYTKFKVWVKIRFKCHY